MEDVLREAEKTEHAVKNIDSHQESHYEPDGDGDDRMRLGDDGEEVTGADVTEVWNPTWSHQQVIPRPPTNFATGGGGTRNTTRPGGCDF